MASDEWNHGYNEGYAAGLRVEQRKRAAGLGVPMPNKITLCSNYPDKEPDWTSVQVYRIDFAAGPPQWWCVAQPATSKRTRRGHRTRTWAVLSNHSTQDRAMSARSGVGRGIGTVKP